MEDVLRALGLAERIGSFRQQRIEASQFAELSDDDLRELGLTIGERRRFRRAFPIRAAAEVPPIAAEIAGERRPLTMQFIDIVNSTALGEQLDAEDLLELIRTYREFCGASILRVGGHVARFMGDGILAYFCYPVATENDPERAVRSAIEIVAGLGDLRVPVAEPLRVRIGIATGSVIVSDLFAGGEADKRSVIGATPNLAARLQRYAPPNGIVLAHETYERVHNLFDCEALGTDIVRRDGSPTRAWCVLRERARKSRARDHGRTPPVLRGRDAELEQLSRAWRAARAGDGQVLVLSGEAGIGKSCTIERFMAETPEAAQSVILLAASELDQDTPFHPVIEHLKALATGDETETPDTETLLSVLAGSSERRTEMLPFVAALLGVADAPPIPSGLTPQQRRDRTLAALRDQLLSGAWDSPACLVVEDLHWLDPSTLELLDLVVAEAPRLSLLVLATTRPDYAPDWQSMDHVELIQLRRLQQTDIQLLVRDLFGALAVPAALLHRIMERSDGVPLFVQEIVRSVLAAANAAMDDSVPASLQESLMARLDQLGDAKQVAQTAAVIGRTVTHRVLATVTEMAESTLSGCLARLEDSGVLRREGNETYVFTHALVRDIAYDSMLRDRKRELHRRVARALESLEPGFAVDQPAAMALHLTEAGELESGSALWILAARRSLDASALLEATRLLRRGLTALERAPASAGVLGLRIELMGLLGPALMSLRGPGATETQELYDRAKALCQTLPEQATHFPIYWGWWRVSKDYRTMLERSALVLSRAREHSDPEFLIQAHHCNWASHYNLGQFAACHHHIAEGLRCYGEGDWRHLAPLYGNHDPRACAHGELALLHWMQGKPRSAGAEKARSLGWADGLDHLGSRIHSMDIALTFEVMRRKPQAVFEQAHALTTLTAEHGLTDHEAKGQIYRGWTVALHEDPAAGVAMLRDGLAMQNDIGTSEDFPLFVCMLAEALVQAGDPDRAIEELLRARTSFDAMGLRVWMPDVLRTTADAMLAADPASTTVAEALLHEAADLARSQDVAMLAMRTATSHARLLSRLGDHERAHDLLAPARAAIVEHCRGHDLDAAETLLAELGARLGRAPTA